MQAFHNDEKVKQKYLDRIKKHRLADNLIQGKGWESGKGCAVGCTLENYDHKQYEVELGIPEWIARVEDTVFEGLNREDAQVWPERFLAAIKPGANLEVVKKPFLIFILEENLKTLDSLKIGVEFAEVLSVIEQTKVVTLEVIRCHREGINPAARAAAWAAESAASAAESAAAYTKYADKLIELLSAVGE